MKQRTKTLLGGGVIALSLFGIALAGQLEDGAAAYQRGDYAAAMRFWHPLADQGNASAQYNIGVMYRDGEGVPQDYPQALVWFRKAADQGDANAQNNLGVMYRDGEGVPQDYPQALVWFHKAAAQGDAEAQYNIGRMYTLREGVPQNYAQALVWLRKAAAQGNADAQFGLGVMYRDGEGVPRDYPQALVWFHKAAAQGNAFARDALGQMSGTGQAVSQAASPVAPVPSTDGSEVLLQKQYGTFLIPVLINNSIVLNFIIDSGAADVSIPADVVMTLVRTGTITHDDFLGSQIYTLADGSHVPSETFRIRNLKVGDIDIQNVIGSVAKIDGSLLLGQSFITRFKSWSIDNERGVLVLKY